MRNAYKLEELCSFFIRTVVSPFIKTIPNRILFMTYNNDYICNPKYIAEEIIRQKRPWELIWVVDSRGVSHVPDPIKTVRRGSIGHALAACSAKIWIDNATCFTWGRSRARKKTNQYLINTWHGSLGIKRFDEAHVQDKRWVKHAKIAGAMTDYCVSNSTFEDNVYRSTYWQTTPILKYGHPRNDCLFNQNIVFSVKKKVFDYYNISPSDKLMLYAPTFRNNEHIVCQNIDFDTVIRSLEKKFSGTWKILVKLHFHDKNKNKYLSCCSRYIIDATDYPDFQELMIAADAGMTDYSSWAYDYILLRKPLFIFAPDLNDYLDDRGLYYPLSDTPFLIAQSPEQIPVCIEGFDDNSYQDKITNFLAEKGCVEDGEAASRVVNKISDLINM